MPKYMIQTSYTAEGVKGLLKSGGSARRKAAEDAVASVNGRLEAFYFTFGADDAVLIVDVPDDAAAAALSLGASASGAVRPRTMRLLTPEEIDEAAKKRVDYRPPGQ
jgi:uncharacterized protein with GYD domain